MKRRRRKKRGRTRRRGIGEGEADGALSLPRQLRRVRAFKSKAEPRIYRNQRSPPYLGDGGKSA